MYCRYKKKKEDMPLSAAFRLRLRLQPKKIEDNTYGSWLFAPQTNVIYLLLSSSNSLYLQSKRNFRKLNYEYVSELHLELDGDIAAQDFADGNC